MKRMIGLMTMGAMLVGCDPADSGGAGGQGEKGIGGSSGSSPASRTDMGTPGSGSNQNTRGTPPKNASPRSAAESSASGTR